MFVSEVIIPLSVAVFVSASLTPVVTRLGIAFGVMDRPNARKVSQRKQIPLMGGVSIFLGCLTGLFCFWFTEAGSLIFQVKILGYVSGGLLLLLVGLWDDRFYLSAWQKLPFQLIASVIAVVSGFSIDFITIPFSESTHSVPVWLSFPFSVLWILLVTNAMNLIDGLDGLASGMGAIVATTLVVICWQAGQFYGVVIGVALLGALIGFLPFNFPPARIFLGDAGALFLGYSLAVVSIQGYRKEALLTFMVPLLALAVPLLDTGLSILRRIRMGKQIFSADNMHMHHRLLRKEGTHRRAVLWLYLQTACFGLIAVSFSRLDGLAAYILLLVVAILTIRLLKNLGLFSIDLEANGHAESVELPMTDET